MPDDQEFEGGCYCGAVRYQITTRPTWAAHCHCRSCQLALGAAFATWARVPAANFTILKGSVKTVEKSPNVRRGFCADCGTSLTYAAGELVEGNDWSEDAWFAGATLDDPSILELKSHVYVCQQQPWIKMADGLPVFEKF